VHVPYTLEQDEDGVWCAHAWLGASGGANGNGMTPEDAVADLREAVQMVIDEDGVPEQLCAEVSAQVSGGGRESNPPTTLRAVRRF
jgi:hypothetical protein